jgi:hypothetical protein
MTPPTSIARQILYAAALTTGIALMGILAGCARPESALAAPGFPHASRRAMPTMEPTTERASLAGPGLRPSAKAVSQAALFEAMWLQPQAGEP